MTVNTCWLEGRRYYKISISGRLKEMEKEICELRQVVKDRGASTDTGLKCSARSNMTKEKPSCLLPSLEPGWRAKNIWV